MPRHSTGKQKRSHGFRLDPAATYLRAANKALKAIKRHVLEEYPELSDHQAKIVAKERFARNPQKYIAASPQTGQPPKPASQEEIR